MNLMDLDNVISQNWKENIKTYYLNCIRFKLEAARRKYLINMRQNKDNNRIIAICDLDNKIAEMGIDIN